ncbi:hypothetical protein OSTOST_16809 [Ostertagia ostertagi]
MQTKDYATLRCNIIKVSKIPDMEVNKCLQEVLQSMKVMRSQTENTVRLKCSKTRPDRIAQLAPRGDLPLGRPRKGSPIRKLVPRSSRKKKQGLEQEPTPLPNYGTDDVNFCAVCFRRDPRNPSDKENTMWLKCTVCKRWAHEDCTNGEGSPCPLDDGVYCCSLVNDHE